jgi:hypothetical protein
MSDRPVSDPELRFPIELLPQRLALDEGHHVVEEPVGRAGIEQRQDVGMLKAGGGPDLHDEPLGTQDGGELGL